MSDGPGVTTKGPQQANNLSNPSAADISLDERVERLAILGLGRAVAATSTTLGTVQAVISAEYQRLASKRQPEVVRRDNARLFAWSVASAFVVPAALLFAVLAIGTTDISGDVSVFSLHYLGLWVLYISVTLGATAALIAFRIKEKLSRIVLPKLSAHRGGPENAYPPNSLEAIRAVLDVGVDMVEFDVRTTSDGKFITYHDDHVTDEGGNTRQIAQLTEAEVFVAAPDAASLSDVLALIKGKALGHVDLKDTCLEVEIADTCERALGPDGFVLTTLEDVSVRRLRTGRPHLKVALSLGRSTAGLGTLETARLRLSEVFPQQRLRRCDPNMLALNHKIARLGVLALARRRGLPVLIWTINDPGMIASVAADPRYWGYSTDFPRLAVSLR